MRHRLGGLQRTREVVLAVTLLWGPAQSLAGREVALLQNSSSGESPPAVPSGRYSPDAWTVDNLPRGEVIPELVSPSNPSQRYSVYLPPGYDASAPPPVFVLMKAGTDPSLPMARALPGARNLGYMLVSAFGTRSDGPVEPSREAINAILEDLQGPLPARMDRLYLAGFSGTARLAWAFGYQLAPNVAGVFGMGAGVPPSFDLARVTEEYGTPFAFFGGAGVVDFNFDEVVRLRDEMRASGIPFRVRVYPGPHAWPEAEVFTEAMEWWSQIAVSEGKPEPYPGFLSQVIRRDFARVESLRRSGELEDARDLSTSIRELSSDAASRRRAEALVLEIEAEEGFAAHVALRRSRATAFYQHADNVAMLFAEFSKSTPLLEHDAMVDALELAVIRQARGDADTELAQFAERMWASVYTHAAFYEPTRYLRSGDLDRARAVLRIAETMTPGNGRVCWMMARVEARADDHDRAFEYLECALNAGGRTDLWSGETDLAVLRSDERYRELQRRFGGD